MPRKKNILNDIRLAEKLFISREAPYTVEKEMFGAGMLSNRRKGDQN